MKQTKKWLDENKVNYKIFGDGKITIVNNLKIKDDVALDGVGQITGYVAVHENASFNAPALTKSGYVYVHENASFNAPALTRSGNVYVCKNASFNVPALTEVSGYVAVHENASFTAPALTKSGYINVYENASFTAPALTESGDVDVHENASFNAPALTRSGRVTVRQNSTFNAPALTCIDEVRCEGEFLGKQITVIDGIGCVILSAKQQNDITIRYCQKSQFKQRKLIGDKFYVASKGIYHAHAKTIKQAIEELNFKTGSRDISQYRNMPPDTKKSPTEWAFVYRMITGACQYGVKSFIESKGKLKKQYTLYEIIEQTRNSYGHSQFCNVVGLCSERREV